MVREGGEGPGEEAYDSLDTDRLLFRVSSGQSRRRIGARSGEESGKEAYDSLETDPLLFRGSSRQSRRRNGARRR